MKTTVVLVEPLYAGSYDDEYPYPATYCHVVQATSHREAVKLAYEKALEEMGWEPHDEDDEPPTLHVMYIFECDVGENVCLKPFSDTPYGMEAAEA